MGQHSDCVLLQIWSSRVINVIFIMQYYVKAMD